METQIFDTHAHYDDKAFDSDRDEVLCSLQEAGVWRVVNVGSSLISCKTTLNLAAQYPFVYAAIGIHPSESKDLSEGDLAWLKEAARDRKVVAIGEIGLDYHWEEPEREIQQHWFMCQLQLAKECNLPVIIHSRDAARDTFELLDKWNPGTGGVFHCFSYSAEMARQAMRLGFYIGLGGVLTFHNARKCREVAETIPLSRIVLETDCPYLAPVPYRGKRNDSRNLPLVAEALAAIKGVSEEEVIETTRTNALHLYHMTS